MFGKKKKSEEEKGKKEEIKEGNNKENNPEEVKEKSDKEKQQKIKEKLSQGYIRCHFIFEIVGKPAEYIEQIMDLLLKQLEKEPNILLISRSLNKSANYKDSEDLFTTFSETEILIESFKRLVQIIFDYMPSSIEIFEPEEIRMKIQDLNLLVNELSANLHRKDLANKKVLFEKNVLFEKLKEIKGKVSEEKPVEEKS